MHTDRFVKTATIPKGFLTETSFSAASCLESPQQSDTHDWVGTSVPPDALHDAQTTNQSKLCDLEYCHPYVRSDWLMLTLKHE